MELIDKSVPARTTFSGDDNFIITAGQILKIETTPQGVDCLNVEVPSGEEWSVNLYVQVIKTVI